MSIAASAPHKQAPFSKIVSAVASARTQLRAGASLNSVIRPALLNVPLESRPAAQALIYESVRRCARTTALVGLLCSRQPSAEVLSVLETAFAAFSLGRLAVFTVVSETVTAAKANPQTRAASGFINAVLRRTEIPEDTKKRLVFDKLIIDLDSYELIVDGKKIDTPPKELELLYHLAATPNRVYTRNQLLDEVWGFDYFGDSRTVDVHIKRLREKVENVSDQWELKTVWGVGYKFEVKK